MQKSFLDKILNVVLKNKSDTEVSDSSKQLRRFAKDIIKPNLGKILVALLFMAIFSGMNASLAFLVKPIMNQVFVFKDIASVYNVGFMLIGVSLVKSASQYIYIIILSGVSIAVIANARNKLYDSFLKQDMKFFHKNSPGSLISVMMNDINAINTLATELPINFGRDLLSFLGLLIVMFIQEPLYATVIFFSIFFIVIPIRLSAKSVKNLFGKSNKGFGELTSHLEQSLNGIREVKSYAMEHKERTNTQNIIESIRKSQGKIRKITAIVPTLMEAMGGVSVALILMYGGYSVIYHGASPGTFFSFIAALLLAYQPLKRLTDVTIKIQFGLLGIKRYYTFIDMEPSIVDKKDAMEIKLTSAEINFNNVSFSYDTEEASPKYILKNINMSIKEGQRVALVGRSGGGKSTMLNLISRFYEPQIGNITINKYDIKDITTKSLRDSISLVSQDVVIFDDTVYNNIAYSKPNATYDEVINAANLAECTSFVEHMSDKFETQVGSRGMKLSGGQKQRISIARAILKNAPILLLDEATSALDNESESLIQKSLQLLMLNKTTVVIAHRLSTIVNSDVIFVIEKGEIVEYGNHDELLLQNSSYKYFYDLQFKEQEISK